MTILDELAAHAQERVAAAKRENPLEAVRRQALSLPKGDFAFENALKKPGVSFICECKKASPSKGIIAPDFPYLEIAREYEAAGADCLSVLTEPKWFLGSDRYLKEIAGSVSLPCLRKDFTVDAYMIYEARLLGASAVLLICSLLGEDALRFDWQWVHRIHRPFFLAGGLNPENVESAVKLLRPFAVDVSSGIETDGRKDRTKSAAFVAAVRRADASAEERFAER